MSAGRIGVYLCHCGRNIAATVDVEGLARTLEAAPGVSVVRHYPYLCSRPGQDLIRSDLEAGRVDRVVVAACSPRMHEATFRRVLASAGTNPYLLCHVNVREQCSWVHPDPARATAKALDLVRMGLGRVRRQEPLAARPAPVERRALVLGGGPAGLSAASALRQAGVPVVLVEQEPSLGGRARVLARAFPGCSDARSWIEGLAVRLGGDPGAEVFTRSELGALEGAPGRFEARIRTPSGTVERVVGAVIAATGYALYRPDAGEGGRPELGLGRYPEVVTQEEMEARLRERRDIPAGGRAVFVQCVGSRDRSTGAFHCSRVCCMVSVRQATALRRIAPGLEVQVLYIDLRAYARGAEEDYDEAGRLGVVFRRGSVSEVYRRAGRPVVRFEDTLLGRAEELEADLVVLACGARPRPDAGRIARTLGLARGPDGFFLEAHPKLRPVESATAGVFLAGACLGPRTLDEAATSGRAAAARALALLLPGEMPVSPVTAWIDPDLCAGCGLCEQACPAGAIRARPHLPARGVDPAACTGCGACAAVCPSKAAALRHFRPEQVLAELEACLPGA